jgi:peptidoglycan hydrolase-like protein with peptidoglycan-binding domain
VNPTAPGGRRGRRFSLSTLACAAVIALLVVELLLVLWAFSFAAPANGAAAGKRPVPRALRLGDRGRRVRDAQYLERGHNVFRIGTYRGPIDGSYGSGSAAATRRMKYRLGYPPLALNGRFGHVLYLFLTGKRSLPPAYQARKHRRWLALERKREGARQGVVALVGGCRSAPPKPYVLVYARRVAAVYGRPLVCVSGTRHTLVHGTHHWSMHNWGAAADLATPTERMNLDVGRAALIAAGMPRATAAKIVNPCNRPDLGYCFWYRGVNILFQTYVGGNHHNHVHVGLWSWPTAQTPRGATLARSPQAAAGEFGAWSHIYQYGLSAPAGSRLAYAIVAVKRELAYNGFPRSMVVGAPAFGDAARTAAAAFQRAHGLKPDGRIGPATALSLFRKRALAVETQLGIPNHLLARDKTLESANDPGAVGENGIDTGLEQIYLTAHPGITIAQATDPAFALPWAGRYLLDNFAALHDWQAAIAAHNVGRYYAGKWLAAGKPAAGGPIFNDGRDAYTVASRYVQLVQASPY